MQKTLIASILLITATAATSNADVGKAAEWLKQAKRGDLRYDPPNLDDCSSAIEAARKAGKTRLGWHPDFDAFGGKDGYLAIDNAEPICREAIFYRDVVRKDIEVFTEFNDMMFAMLHGTNDMTYYKHVQDLADKCDKAVDAMLAAKVDPSTPFVVGTSKHKANTVGEIKPNVCAAARSESQRIEKERTDKTEGERAPFLAVGIKDDKLEFVVKNDGEIFLVGKKEPRGPKDYAKASTMFLWTTREPDIFNYVVHTVYKHVFKGNKLVKESYKTYRLRDGQNPGAAAFK
jgi:hypothetical protein